MTCEACSPRIRALKMSGYWVAEWLPQIVTWRDVGDGHARLDRQLAGGPVVVEPGEGVEAFRGDVRGVAQGDQRVGVGRVARDQDLDVVRGVVVQRAALRLEDGPVGLEQVAALHALAAGARADEEGEVHAVEDLVGVVARHDGVEQRVGAVVELHDDTLERLQRRGDLEQAQLDRLVRAEQLPARDPEQQAVADLPSGSGDGDLHGCAHGSPSHRCRRPRRRR